MTAADRRHGAAAEDRGDAREAPAGRQTRPTPRRRGTETRPATASAAAPGHRGRASGGDGAPRGEGGEVPSAAGAGGVLDRLGRHPQAGHVDAGGGGGAKAAAAAAASSAGRHPPSTAAVPAQDGKRHVRRRAAAAAAVTATATTAVVQACDGGERACLPHRLSLLITPIGAVGIKVCIFLPTHRGADRAAAGPAM